MRASVQQAWPAHARQFEGVLPFMYLDTLNNVTIGIGTLMQADTAPERLLNLPWFDKMTKLPATRKQLLAEYEYVQSRTDLAPRGGNAFRDVTDYRISDSVMDDLLLNETQAIWNRLVQNIPELPQWQADAQLAMLDMGYNLGPNFLNLTRYADIRSAVAQRNYSVLAKYCLDRSKTDLSRATRWKNRVQLYTNANLVVELGINQETFWGSSPNLKEMEMALADEIVSKLLNDPLIDDPVTKTKKSLKWCVEKMRNDTYAAYANSRNILNEATLAKGQLTTIITEVDQTEELLTTVLAEVDQTEEGLAKAEKARIDREARLAEAYKS